jgi:DNA-binding NarL/FixJ family response regulator
MAHKILIADGHEGIRRRLRSLLETAGFLVCGEAVNGQQAVEKSKELMPDLVILDLSMPVISGFEAIRKIAELNNPKILVLTLLEDSDEANRIVAELGAQGYLHKSSLSTALLAEVSRILGVALVLTLLLH